MTNLSSWSFSGALLPPTTDPPPHKASSLLSSHPSHLLVRTTGLGPLGRLGFPLPGSREAPNSPLLQNPCFLKLQSVQLCPAPLGPCCGNCADSILWPCVQESLRARLRPWNTSWSAGPKRRGGHFPGKRRSKQPSANSSNNRAIEMHSLVADGTSGAGAVAGSGLG